MTSGSLRNYYRAEINDDANENNAVHININNSQASISKSFKYNTKLTGSTPNNNNILDAEVVVPLKYLSNSCRSLDLPWINCDTEIDWPWLKECIIPEISIALAIAGNLNARPHLQAKEARQTTGKTFQINNAKLYVPVVILSTNDNIKVLENIKQAFKRTISWNKHRSEIATQAKYKNLNYLIDPAFRNTNKLFVLSFKNDNYDSTRNSFDRYFMALIEIIDFISLIDNKPFFDQPVKGKQEAYEKLIDMSKNDDY